MGLCLALGGTAVAQPPGDAPADQPVGAPAAEAPGAGGEANADGPPRLDASADPQPDDGVDHQPDQALQIHRTPLDKMLERAIGQTSRRVKYDWRRDTVQAGIIGGLPAELNNFDSLRGGVFVRFPTELVTVGFEVSYIGVSGSRSTRRLARTPYRQPGRPDRWEIDVIAGYPLAEGIATAVPGFFPATQIVLMAYADLRYLYYPGAWAGLSTTRTLRTMVDPSLRNIELENLEDDRLPGMEIDRARIVTNGGLGAELYFGPGFFLSHRILVGLPLFEGATETKMRLGLELDLTMGWSF